MRQPYVTIKVSKRTGQARYTGMYYDAMGTPRSAGTYDGELEALTAARHEKGKSAGDSLDSMTLAQKRAVTFEEFWPIFQRHHRVRTQHDGELLLDVGQPRSSISADVPCGDVRCDVRDQVLHSPCRCRGDCEHT